MTPVLFLAELTAYDRNLGTTRVLRYASQQGYVTGASDVPANTFYDARIKQPVNVSRDCFSRGKTTGQTRIGYGDLILLNGDGELDGLIDLALNGRNITIWRTEVANPRYPVDFRQVIVGTMEQPEFTSDTVTVRLRDRQAELMVPLNTTKYAGTNALPAGLEGVATDLKGKPKPVCFGYVTNIAPPSVNTSRLIYQVHDSAISTVDAVYDRGVALTKGADYTSQSDMETTAPAASNFRVWPAGGYFRLGTSPSGLITADVTQGASASERTAAQIYSQLIQRARLANPSWGVALGKASRTTDTGDRRTTDTGDVRVIMGDVSEADLSALAAADSSVLGFWTDEEATVAEVCDLVAATVGAWWGVDREGVFRIKQLVSPATGTAVATFTEHDMLKPPARLPTADEGKGIPVYRYLVRWGKNYVTQTTDVAASVTDARKAAIAAEWREAVSTDTAVQVRHLLSPEIAEDSLYTTEAAALAEAGRRLTLRNVRRDRFEIRVPLTNETDDIDLGQIVNIDHPRHGLNIVGSDDGKPFVVIGVEPDAMAHELTLDVWGSSTGRDNRVTDTGDYRVTDTGAYRTTAAE